MVFIPLRPYSPASCTCACVEPLSPPPISSTTTMTEDNNKTMTKITLQLTTITLQLTAIPLQLATITTGLYS